MISGDSATNMAGTRIASGRSYQRHHILPELHDETGSSATGKDRYSLFVVHRERNRFFRSKYPESGGGRDLPEPLFPIAGKDKFSDLWRPCGASILISISKFEFSPHSWPWAHGRCAPAAGGRSSCTDCFVVSVQARLLRSTLHARAG